MENQNKIEKKIEKELRYKWTIIFFFSTLVSISVLIFILMGKIPSNYYTQIMVGLAFIGLFIAYMTYKVINRTIGFKFLLKIYKANIMKNKGYGFVKEFRMAGKPEYHLVKYDDIIRYNTKVNGEDKEGLALFNPYAKYEDFGANIPVVEATYNDISLKNVFTGNRIGMNPDLADKIIVERGISPKDFDDVKKHRRWLMYLLVGIGIVGIISFDLFAQRLADANQSVIQCYQEAGKSATIVAGGFVKSGLDYLRNGKQ